MEGNAVEGQVVCVSREEVLLALNETKTAKAPGPSKTSLEMTAACWEVEIQVRTEICPDSRWTWNAI